MRYFSVVIRTKQRTLKFRVMGKESKENIDKIKVGLFNKVN